MKLSEQIRKDVMGISKPADYYADKVVQLEAKYNELIFAVVNKHPDETRHETALRYIQERERRVSGPSEERPVPLKPSEVSDGTE